MRILKTLLASVFALVGLSSAVSAVPVTFTYTSDAVDLSNLNEDWQRAFFQSHWALRYLNGRQARISLEVDCTISSGRWSCAELQHSVGTYHIMYFSDRRAESAASGLKVVSARDFTDSGVFGRTFKVDETGQVIEWDLEGLEYGQVGDFRLSHRGDTYAWSFEDYPSSFFYCLYTFGVDLGATRGTCANGAAARSITREIHLGNGTWSVDASSILMTAPLPAGVPLMLSGIGLFAVMRRRRPKAASGTAGHPSACQM